jgi:DNA repair exonuclease SbcCD ATPase subunit
MRTPTFFQQVVLSLVLSSLLLFPGAQPARAQWAVFDPTNYALQVAKKIEEATRWLQTVQQYVAMYQKAIEQVSTLGGILTVVDEQITKNKRLVEGWATVGRLVRGIFQLKRQIENAIRADITAIVSISRRYRNGIFDMDANKRDLDNYLKHAIGRNADANLKNLERLAKLDVSFQRMLYDRELITAELALLYKQQEELQQKVEQMRALADADQDKIEQYLAELREIGSRIATLELRLDELKKQIEEKCKFYGIKIEEMTKFGEQVRQTEAMMTTITKGTSDFYSELEKYEVWRNDVLENQFPW